MYNAPTGTELHPLQDAWRVPARASQPVDSYAPEWGTAEAGKIEQSRKLVRAKGFTFNFLSDPKAEVIRRYGVLHPGAGEDGTTSPGPPSSWWTRRGPSDGSS